MQPGNVYSQGRVDENLQGISMHPWQEFQRSERIPKQGQ